MQRKSGKGNIENRSYCQAISCHLFFCPKSIDSEAQVLWPLDVHILL